MLERQFGIDNPDQVLLENGVCRPCMALPVAERNKLAESVINREMDHGLRDLIKRALLKKEN